MKALHLLLAVGLGCAASAPAFADPTPPAIPGVPSDVLNSPLVQSILNALGGVLQTTNGNTAAGRVSYFKRFDLQLETAPRVYRNVHLHQGTVINPRGATLASGMLVVVNGTSEHDGSLDADTITIH